MARRRAAGVHSPRRADDAGRAHARDRRARQRLRLSDQPARRDGRARRLPPELPETMRAAARGDDAAGVRRASASRGPEQAAAVARIADGVVVGSAIVRAAGESVDAGGRARRVAARGDRRGLSRGDRTHEITLQRDALSRARRHPAARARRRRSRSRSTSRCASATGDGVVDYRALYDATAAVVDGGHIDFLEEIAERVARARASRTAPRDSRRRASRCESRTSRCRGPLAYAEVVVDRAARCVTWRTSRWDRTSATAHAHLARRARGAGGTAGSTRRRRVVDRGDGAARAGSTAALSQPDGRARDVAYAARAACASPGDRAARGSRRATSAGGRGRSISTSCCFDARR